VSHTTNALRFLVSRAKDGPLKLGRAFVIAMLAAFGLGNEARAQESTRVPVATSPGQGRFYYRQLFSYVHQSDDPSPEVRTIEKLVALSRFSYGINSQLSINADVPLVYANERSPSNSHHGRGQGTDEMGVADIPIDLKWRPFQWDLGPVDTLRLAFLGGVEIPTFDKDFSSDGFDPYFGVVFTGIIGRHGINQSVRYKINTNGVEYPTIPGDGSTNALYYDTSYLFRVLPAEYTASTPGSLYLTAEMTGIYEMNGDNEILLGPGIIYEAPGFAIEAAAGLPIVQDIDQRPRTDLVVSIGFRILF
jgi:hypothetical protein